MVFLLFLHGMNRFTGNNIRSVSCLVMVLLFAGCDRKEAASDGDHGTGNTLTIAGTLEGGAGKPVVLEEMAARELIPLDTVICNDSGDFAITTGAHEVAFYVLRYGTSGYVTLLLEPGESVHFSGEYDRIESYEIKGSSGSVLLQTLAREHRKTLDELREVARTKMEISSSPGYVNLKQALDRQFDSITNAFRNYSLNFIHENAGSLSILVALYNLYGQGLPVFDPQTDFTVYEFVDSALMSSYSGFEAVKLLNAQVKEAGMSLKNQAKTRMLQEGGIAPDFVSSRPDGSLLALSEFRGNYVLISFWAGWSRLSREENATLEGIMERYESQPFRILQVSLDDNMEQWTNAISEDGLKWDQVSDLLRWEGPVSNLYQVEKIPSNVLINPEGRIIGIDLLGDRLLEKLEQIFND